MDASPYRVLKLPQLCCQHYFFILLYLSPGSALAIDKQIYIPLVEVLPHPQRKRSHPRYGLYNYGLESSAKEPHQS